MEKMCLPPLVPCVALGLMAENLSCSTGVLHNLCTYKIALLTSSSNTDQPLPLLVPVSPAALSSCLTPLHNSATSLQQAPALGALLTNSGCQHQVLPQIRWGLHYLNEAQAQHQARKVSGYHVSVQRPGKAAKESRHIHSVVSYFPRIMAC